MGGRYSIELFREGGEGAGMERVLCRYENLSIASALFKEKINEYPERLVMLCDNTRVLSRSDRPDASMNRSAPL